MPDLDPKLTFDSFVVGPANRLASAAARRAAESPGVSYNPLFVYSASGLGKTHILTAIAHHSVRSASDRKVEYMALEAYLEELAHALARGDRDGFKDKYGELDILLLDDVQFLAGQPEAQEMLLRTLDQLSTAGSQIVLASDRPPAEINGLDARLVSRFSGGLIVDIGAPEFETRVAIIRRKSEERGQSLEPGVAEALARYPFKNVRELGGALNRVFATQDLEERQVTPGDVAVLMGDKLAEVGQGVDADLGLFLGDLVETVAEVVDAQEEPWRKAFRQAIDAAEREGYSAQRLKAYTSGDAPADWESFVERFKADIQRLREVDRELDRLENPWPGAAQELLKDPDRLDEAEALLSSVRERQRPFPKLGDGPLLDTLQEYSKMALKAAQQMAGSERPEYNPLYVWSEKSERGRTLLGAVGRTFQKEHADTRMAVTSVQEFAQDFIRALSEGVAGAWRERWWTVDLLLVHGLEALSETERAQDEFFHLFEALKRRGARVMLVADRPPSGIGKIDERLRSRFEGGLVLELDAGTSEGELDLVDVTEPEGEPEPWGVDTAAAPVLVVPPLPVIPPLNEIEVGERAGLFVASGPGPASAQDERSSEVPGDAGTTSREEAGAAGKQPEPVEPSVQGGAWFPSAENVVLVWPRLNDLLQEELD